VVSEQDAQTQALAPARTRERRAIRSVTALGVIVLGVLGFASYKLVVRADHPGKTAAGHRITVVKSTPSPPPASPSPSASATTASSSPSAVPVQVLRPAGVAAFGPAGTADGDGVAQAGLTVDASMATDWRTDWYATPLFGDLQDGTGLLIDMGRPVTITSIGITLGTTRGANFELRAGNTPTLAGTQRVAASAGAGGTLQFKLAKPVQARYVLLWFTALPPDGAGTYQAQVYNVSVTGQP